jgi:twitching motility protein PilT
VCQQLLPHLSGRGRVLATEVMTATPAVRNLIREGKTPQISNAITTSAAEGNHLMDSSLITLFKQRKISSDSAIKHAHDPDYVRRSTLF